ncbi:MAG: hypothetical protein IJF71_05780 [Clostridia bacterium]|nr:hypothetical protein [Clostridia bacterium]
MKKVLTLLLVCMLAFAFTGCGQFFEDFVNSPGAKYNQKMSEATAYQVEMTYQFGEEDVIYVDCTVKDGSYAYVFTKTQDILGGLFEVESAIVYRELWTPEMHYRIQEPNTSLLPVGVYVPYTYANVPEGKNPAECEENAIYYYTNIVTLSSWLSGFVAPVEEEVDGKILRKVAVGDTATYWFDENDLLVKFVYSDSEGNSYKLTYDNYVFDNIDESALAIPTAPLYQQVNEEDLNFDFSLVH